MGRGATVLLQVTESWLKSGGSLQEESGTEAQDGCVTLALPVLPPEQGPPEEKVEDAAYRAQVPRACYLVSGTEKPGTGWRLVALQLGPRRLLLLLSAQSPTHGLRGLATHTLHALTPLL